jgi:hypothetical protein
VGVCTAERLEVVELCPVEVPEQVELWIEELELVALCTEKKLELVEPCPKEPGLVDICTAE